jgi:hypothetical protein
MNATTRLAYRTVLTLSLAACSSEPGPPVVGQTDFVSAPQPGGGRFGTAPGGVDDSAGPPATTTPPTRTVEETDLYRLEGNRLYYLNSYRGLMVFDVSDVDHPKLLGRSPIFGDPVEMLVRDGVAVVVVGDWFGTMDDGTPFHGSIVRGLDATDPTHIQVLGEAKLGGWVRDTRVVGDVLYAVGEDYGWIYGWGLPIYDVGGGTSAGSVTAPTVIVSSVSFAGGSIRAISSESFPGDSGIFNVTPESILLAHDPGGPTAETELLYLDISDPGGQIVRRGAVTVPGRAQGWGVDNGRWNLDFADGKTAHVIGCGGGQYGCDYTSGYLLDTVDFSNPDAPVVRSTFSIAATGWSAAARFDTNRLYLSPFTYDYSGSNQSTPFEVFDLTDPKSPKPAGTVSIPGTVWNILLAPQQRIFALGNDWSNDRNGNPLTLQYLDATNPSTPQLLGTAKFGEGWAWTPAAGTFKAFTMDVTKGLVVLPFSGWSQTTGSYLNGLQLIEFTPTSERVAGAAQTKGWVERGIFVGDRLVSLSDLAMSVIDYANHDSPRLTAELTLARNVIAAQPGGATIAEVSTDWWGNDVSTSEVRVLPIGNAEESEDAGNAVAVKVEGVNARVFRNGDLTYVVTDVQVTGPCPGAPAGTPPTCMGRAEQVQVVDLSNGGAVLRGKIRLPIDSWHYWWWWGGFFWFDWYDGADVVQFAGDGLAFRRWEPIYVYDKGGYTVDANSALFVVDLANPDSPQIASVTITDQADAWWGNMRLVGQTLYTTHYEWFQKDGDSNTWTVRYFADRVDLSDRRHPRVESKINVPGLILGGSDSDPSLIYTTDYRWEDNIAKNDFDVVRVNGDTAQLLSRTRIDGWVGNTFIRGNIAYLSAQSYNANDGHVNLHAIDLSKPTAPVDRVASDQDGFGWLLDVEGDRAIVSSGWGQSGVDIYQLAANKPPRFVQFARTRGYWTSAIARQDSALFLSTGYWGVQRIDLTR